MRRALFPFVVLAISLAHGQSVQSVYNRDSHDPFKLKGVTVQSTVIGPIVRTCTTMTYENPYKNLTEASMNFELTRDAALGGFAYYYGKELVPGQLMDKAKAWFIYTAITSRNEDPGIMSQWTPTLYHCQIYPLKVGSDLKVKLHTIEFMTPRGDAYVLPKPQVGDGPFDWTARVARGGALAKDEEGYKVDGAPNPITAVAQRFKDGRIYVAGLMRAKSDSPYATSFAGLNEPKTVQVGDAVAFMGWMRNLRKMAIRHNGVRAVTKPILIHNGPESARLWAQQRLANDPWKSRADVLKFSLKYGVPSNATALLAVPKEKMSLFRQKEREFQRKQAMDRRRELANARRARTWQSRRSTNWNSSSGGDPEVRVKLEGAQRAYAVMPDGRVQDLTEADGYWGTNFEIPADAPEGSYRIKAVGIREDGSRVEQDVDYQVDRTPPAGKAELKLIDGRLVVEVRSEAGLSVWLYDENGEKVDLKEVEPGVYRATLDVPTHARFTITLKDRASNRGEIVCSWPR